MQLLTHSRLTTIRSCLERHRLRYVLGLVPQDVALELILGTLVHLGLEVRWRTFDIDAALEAMTHGDIDPFERARAMQMVRAYHYRWAHDADEYDVLGVEEEFRAPLINPATGGRSKTWRLGGKLDVRVRERRGDRVLVVEHKTTAEDITQGSAYWRKRVLDSQISLYHDGARALGHDVAGCLYDVLGKPDLRPKLATPVESRRYTKGKRCKACKEQPVQCPTCFEAEPSRLDARQRLEDETVDEFADRVGAELADRPELYFARGEVARLGAQLDRHRLDVWNQAKRAAGPVDRNPDACVRGRMVCPFLSVCCSEVSEDAFERTARIHPELSSDA